MNEPNPHTKTGRQQLARRARKWGHHEGKRKHYMGGLERIVKVRCPLCREWVETPQPTWRTATVTQALDRAVISHLADTCTQLHRSDT